MKKLVLAYSGGLDTSVILRCLQTTYRCELVTLTPTSARARSSNPRGGVRD